MQGYVGANSIFVYLIENIENQPLDFSGSAFKKDDRLDDESSNRTKIEIRNRIIDDTTAFHQARISSVLTKIAEQKRKQLRIKYRMS